MGVPSASKRRPWLVMVGGTAALAGASASMLPRRIDAPRSLPSVRRLISGASLRDPRLRKMPDAGHVQPHDAIRPRERPSTMARLHRFTGLASSPFDEKSEYTSSAMLTS